MSKIEPLITKIFLLFEITPEDAQTLKVSGCAVQMDYTPPSWTLMDTVLSFHHLPFPITVASSPRINSSLNFNLQPSSKSHVAYLLSPYWRTDVEWKFQLVLTVLFEKSFERCYSL